MFLFTYFSEIFLPLAEVFIPLIVANAVFAAVAVYCDARSRGIESAASFGVITPICPLLVGIIYACVRKKLCRSEFSEKHSVPWKKISTASLVLALACVVTMCAVNCYSIAESVVQKVPRFIYNVGNKDHYDKQGNICLSGMSYYDRDGKTYFITDDASYEYDDGTIGEKIYFTDLDGGEYSVGECFIDAEGYFVRITKQEQIQRGMHRDMIYLFFDAQSDLYYDPRFVYWDESGNIRSTIDDFAEIFTGDD